MHIENLTGSIVAIVTPFKDNGEIDFKTFDELLEWHVAEGTDGIVVCGTTGETPALSEQEDAMLIERAVKTINGRIPVIAGSGSNSTSDTIKYSLNAQNAGADGLLIVAPYYNKPSDAGLYHHFAAVANAVEIPIVLYNVPSRTGSCIPASLALKLADDFDNIIAIKEAGGDINVFVELLQNRPAGFKVYSGDDFLSTSANLLGADGCISVIANIVPGDFHKLMEASVNGNVDKSRDLFFKYKNLMKLMAIESNPLPVKTALSLMGKSGEAFRLPLCSMEDENKEILKLELKRLNLM
ncbi:4-hydroxy-tetrahydrodipicolinate synthase [Marinilabiliaceae bacterium ANBcel2]|nr:4-hydroxy-tetrahydrodipicolinate synthase [Marinilabiliaceae bacterium ANBcel2]